SPPRLHSSHLRTSTSCLFFTHPATTEIYPLSLHDALPISANEQAQQAQQQRRERAVAEIEKAVAALEGEVGEGHGKATPKAAAEDRKSTRLNSSHVKISYAVFCLKKKKKKKKSDIQEITRI